MTGVKANMQVPVLSIKQEAAQSEDEDFPQPEKSIVK